MLSGEAFIRMKNGALTLCLPSELCRKSGASSDVARVASEAREHEQGVR